MVTMVPEHYLSTPCKSRTALKILGRSCNKKLRMSGDPQSYICRRFYFTQIYVLRCILNFPAINKEYLEIQKKITEKSNNFTPIKSN